MIDVIVCSRGPSNSLYQTIHSILKQEEVFRLVLVTPSHDEFRPDIINNQRITIIKEPPNFCLAWARRLGVNYTISDYVCYVDDDVVLGLGYFRPIAEKIVELEMEYPTFAIEGIMHLYQYNRTKPVLYDEKYLKKGDRGFTHNTTIPRRTLLEWQPMFTFAFEDWLLTQHVLSLGGIWLRMRTPVVTTHRHGYPNWKRHAWAISGERLVKNLTLSDFFIRLSRSVYITLRHLITLKPPMILVDDIYRIIGTTLGYLKCNEWLNMVIKEK